MNTQATQEDFLYAKGLEWMDYAVQMKQERNAAQRELCTLLASESGMLGVRRTPEEIARSRGWDCFPPDKPQDALEIAVRRAYGDPVQEEKP